MVNRLCAVALATLLLALALPQIAPRKSAAFIAEKRQAVLLAAAAREIIGERLLGVEYSEITTTIGHKDAKVLSAASDFPALLVQWLKEAGVEKGDTVAINASGSFPALTIAALAAVKAAGAKPLLIASLGSSSWGANRPDFTWLHMERELTARWPEFAGIAVSYGGDGDMAHDMSEQGRHALRLAFDLTDAPFLEHEDSASAVSARIVLWTRRNGGKLPAALINTGGNMAFWGTRERDPLRLEGLRMPGGAADGDGVGDVFLREGKPVIHLLGIRKMAARYRITIPPSPDSPLWVTTDISPLVRACVFLLLGGILTAIARMRPRGM